MYVNFLYQKKEDNSFNLNIELHEVFKLFKLVDWNISFLSDKYHIYFILILNNAVVYN